MAVVIAFVLLRLAFLGICALIQPWEGSGFFLFLDVPTVLAFLLYSTLSPRFSFGVVDSRDPAFHILGLLVWSLLGLVLGFFLARRARRRLSAPLQGSRS
ncbi:MAG: hypothetical protein U0529_14505 [Thermoanaerobaculia bacterium]